MMIHHGNKIVNFQKIKNMDGEVYNTWAHVYIQMGSICNKG